MGAIAALVIAVWVGPLVVQSNNPYLSLTSLEGERFTSLTRSGETTSLSGALDSFHQGEYGQAITQFELFVAQNPSSPEAAYAHYLAGVSYLVGAEETILGTVTGFDADKVNRSIEHLRDVLPRTTNLGLQEDSQWYMAKAHLMLERHGEAINILEQVIQLRGRRFRDAQNLISEIELAGRLQ
jgi:tetratricopeptide (TPR) repeat protein